MTQAPVADEVVVRGMAFGALARLLGEDPTPLASGRGVDELGEMLAALGETDALDALGQIRERGPFDEKAVLARRVRLFETGKVAPYELSHVPPGAASHMAVLADVAAFYRAYNLRACDERPDHCVAELEFASLVTLAEADCRARGDEEGGEINAAAARRFIGDHLGGWLGIFASKLDQADPEGPYGPVVLAAARFVDSEASRRGVIPVRRAGIVPDWDDWDDGGPTCGAESFVPGE